MDPLGREAVRRGWLTQARLDEALSVQAELEKQGSLKRLGEILYSRKYLTREQLVELLKVQGKRLALCRACGVQFNLSALAPSRQAGPSHAFA